jgi:6-phosphofructo-2-kinase/fructose-2,6-biphosphatase 4
MIMEQKDKIIISMVGLPARGKSYIGRKLARYLNWVGLKAKVFNNGMYRRILIGVDCKADFFDQQNEEANKMRENCMIEAVNDLCAFLNGIYS